VTTRTDIIDAIAAITRESLDLAWEGRLDGDTPLFEGGLELDSFNVVELIAALETRYDFEFNEDDFVEEHFRTIGTLGGLVAGYIDA
jgi:acyl carrier protein